MSYLYFLSNNSIECAVGSLKEMFTHAFKNMLDVYLGQVGSTVSSLEPPLSTSRNFGKPEH